MHHNLSTWEVEAGELLQVQGLPFLYSDLYAVQSYLARPCLKHTHKNPLGEKEAKPGIAMGVV